MSRNLKVPFLNTLVRHVLIVLIFLKIHRLVYFFKRNKTPILLYHGVSNKKDSKHVYVKSFEKQINHIRSKFNVISLEDLYNYIQTKKKIPNNSLIITFDDGYKNNYLYAYPTLNRNNCPASIFLVTGLVGTKKFIWYDELEFLIFKNIKQNKESVINVNGKEYKIINKGDFFKIKNLIKKNNLYERKLLKQIKLNSKIKPSAEDYDEYSLLNLKEIETMKKNNIMFYPHGHNHNILSKLNDKQLKEEVEKSINFIKQKNISKSVHFFAYPNGKKIDFDNRVTNILKQKNINYALTDQMGLFEIGQNQYELKRISMGETNDYYSFLIRLYFNLFL